MRTQKCRTFIAEKAESSLPPHPTYFSLSLPFLSPLTLWILWIFTGAHDGQGHSSVSIPRAISVCSALGVLPLGFSYTANPVTSRNTGQLKTPWNLASSLLTVTLWLQDDLGDSVSGLRSFPIKVSGRNLVQSGNNHKEFSGQQEVSKLVFQLLLREYEHLKKPLIIKIEGMGFFSSVFCPRQENVWMIANRTVFSKAVCGKQRRGQLHHEGMALVPCLEPWGSGLCMLSFIFAKSPWLQMPMEPKACVLPSPG